MALLEVVLRQVQAGQELINRWNYYANDTGGAGGLSVALTELLGGNPEDMAIAGQFPTGTMLREIQLMQSQRVTFIDISVRDIYSNIDFYETPFPAATDGAVLVATNHQPMTPFVAYGFTSNRIRTDVRRGQKRFGGVTEGYVSENGNIDNGWLDGTLTSVAEAMGEELTINLLGVPVNFIPCVLGKEKYTTPSGKTAYRYYPTVVAQMSKAAIGVKWQPKPQVRSQVSRQYGRGR